MPFDTVTVQVGAVDGDAGAAVAVTVKVGELPLTVAYPAQVLLDVNAPLNPLSDAVNVCGAGLLPEKYSDDGVTRIAPGVGDAVGTGVGDDVGEDVGLGVGDDVPTT